MLIYKAKGSFLFFVFFKKKNEERYAPLALLKYGYSNFSLIILEYCDLENCTEREQHYISLLEPEYNILKTAGSLLGYKHTKETLTRLASINKGKNNPFFGKKHSEQ